MPTSSMKFVVRPAENSCKIKGGLPSLIRRFFRKKNKSCIISKLIKVHFNCCEL